MNSSSVSESAETKFLSSEVAPASQLTRPLLVTMAAACGLAIANLYYNQPLLPEIARTFHASVRQVGVLPMLTQAGFALGVFLLAPLGDILERRRLILIMLALVTLSLVAAALSPNLLFLSVASLAIGVTSVISTQVLPFAVALGSPTERGKTVGSIASAMLMGVLLSRTLSGVVSEVTSWRVMYGVAAVLMVGLAFALKVLLPRSQPTATMSYPHLLRSMWDLTREEALLRQATINGMLLYGSLSAFWATLVFLIESPTYNYGSAVAGMFGLVGATGALGAPFVGKLADKHGPRVLVGMASLGMLVGFALLWLFGTHLLGLISGVIVLDLAAQAATVSNQTTVYSLRPEAHSRLYTVYRASYSLGGSVGAYLGVYAWSMAGWNGVCVVGTGLILVALVLHWVANRNAARRVNAVSELTLETA